MFPAFRVYYAKSDLSVADIHRIFKENLSISASLIVEFLSYHAVGKYRVSLVTVKNLAGSQISAVHPIHTQFISWGLLSSQSNQISFGKESWYFDLRRGKV